MVNLDYFYGSEGEQYRFYQIPAILLEDEETKILEKIYTDENGYADFEQKDFGKKREWLILTLKER